MVVLVKGKATKEDFDKAKEEFGDYIKIVVDIKKEFLAMGGKLHADSEKVLLESGSKQEDIWGGGYDLTTKRLETIAFINIRPNLNNDAMEILDPKVREKFMDIAGKILL